MNGHVVSLVSPKDMHYHRDICRGLGIPSFTAYPLKAACRSINTKKYAKTAAPAVSGVEGTEAAAAPTAGTAAAGAATDITNEILGLSVFPYHSELLSEGIKLAKQMHKAAAQRSMDQKSAVWERSVAEECGLMPDDVYGDREEEGESEEEGARREKEGRDVQAQRSRLQYLIHHRFQVEKGSGAGAGGAGGSSAVAVLGLGAATAAGGAGSVHIMGHGKQARPRIKRGMVMRVTKQSLLKQQLVAGRSWKKDRCVVYRG